MNDLLDGVSLNRRYMKFNARASVDVDIARGFCSLLAGKQK